MRLQILVPHYKETCNVISPLLDSIAVQQNVDLENEVGVIICHDGPDAHDFELEPGDHNNEYRFDRKYPFEIKQIRQEHKGVSAARNACLDAATADYVMFCDIDDMFCNVCGLWILFREMKDGFDSFVSAFIEETRDPETKEVVYVNHDMDSTFVHGKVHRRQYLINRGIRWNDSLTIHEDSYFNILCQSLSENVKYCQTPFYLWKWRDESVCRHDPKYILKTYLNMIDSSDALIDEFNRRGIKDKADFYTAFSVLEAYYMMNKPEWVNQENREYRDNTERKFAEFYLKREKAWKSIPDQDKMALSNSIRSRNVAEGMQMEIQTINSWLKHIKRLSRNRVKH